MFSKEIFPVSMFRDTRLSFLPAWLDRELWSTKVRVEKNDHKQGAKFLQSYIIFSNNLWTYIFFFNLCVGNSQGILSYDVKCICMHMFPHFGPGVVLSVLNFFLKVTSAVEEIYLHFLTIRPFASMFFNKWKGEIVHYYKFLACIRRVSQNVLWYRVHSFSTDSLPKSL